MGKSVLTCLSCDPQMKAETDETTAEEKATEKSLETMETNEETGLPSDSHSIAVDSFESMLLESIFDRLENL